MADDATVPGSPDAADAAASPSGAGLRFVALWHRIRSGEDPLAFGAVLAVLALGAGLFWFWAGAHHGDVAAASPSPERSGPIDRKDAASGRPSAPPENPDSAPPTTGGAVAVHVAGAVLRPGLYHLPGGSRVADAIAAAGGRLARADLDRLNLAARLGDGQKVFVARRGEPVPPDSSGGAGGAAGWSGGAPGAGGENAGGPVEPIDLNAADLAALDSLPGIGPATARAILEERARRGGFRSTRDLLRIPGIGDGRFARLKDHVRV
jgi:competence protein ComEA